MKKMFTFAAMACVALASCTKNESVEVPQQDVITFAEPVTAVNTKAVEICENYPTNEKFAVFAHYFTGNFKGVHNGTLYMNDVETSYKETNGLHTWMSDVTYYWPKQGTLTFAAYSPAKVDNVVYNGSGLHFNGFEVSTNSTEQFDLLFSERSYNQTKDAMKVGAPYDGVELKFNHALSSILFTACVDAADYAANNFKIALNKIYIDKVYSKANFDQGLENADGSVTKPVDQHFGWDGHSIPVEYVAYNSSMILGTTPAYTSNLTGVGKNNQQNSNLILLPQTLDNGQVIKIEYTLYNENVVPAAVIKQTAEFPLETFTSWERGKRYTYNFKFGFDKIYFDPVVTPWDSVTVTPDLNIGR